MPDAPTDKKAEGFVTWKWTVGVMVTVGVAVAVSIVGAVGADFREHVKSSGHAVGLQRLDDQSIRIDRLETRMDKQFDKIDRVLDRIKTGQDRIIGKLGLEAKER